MTREQKSLSIFQNCKTDNTLFCRFVHVEGLREFLFHQNSSAPIVTGEKVREGNNVYIAGGGGYVFTREYLTRFVEMLRDNRTDNAVGCKRSELTAVEDIYISNFKFHYHTITVKFNFCYSYLHEFKTSDNC